MANKTFYECGCMEQGDQMFPCAKHKGGAMSPSERAQIYTLSAVPSPAPAVEIAPPDSEPFLLRQIRARLHALQVRYERDDDHRMFDDLMDLADDIEAIIPAQWPREWKCLPRAIRAPSVDVEALRALPRYEMETAMGMGSAMERDELGDWVKWDDLAALWPPQTGDRK